MEGLQQIETELSSLHMSVEEMENMTKKKEQDARNQALYSSLHSGPHVQAENQKWRRKDQLSSVIWTAQGGGA